MLEARLPSTHFMTLRRGSCLPGGCLEGIGGEGRPGFTVVSKSTVEESKITSEFVIALTIIWDQGHTWWGLQGMSGYSSCH